MGACTSNLTPEEQEASKRSKDISKQLKQDREKQSIKLLLLGTGNSTSMSIDEETFKNLFCSLGNPSARRAE